MSRCRIELRSARVERSELSPQSWGGERGGGGFPIGPDERGWIVAAGRCRWKAL